MELRLPNVGYFGSVEVRKGDDLTLLKGRILRITRPGLKIFVPLRNQCVSVSSIPLTMSTPQVQPEYKPMKLRRFPFQSTHIINDIEVLTLDGHCYTRKEWDQGLVAGSAESLVFALDAKPTRVDLPHWWSAHVRAVVDPMRFEKPIILLMDGLEAYANQYRSAYMESSLSDDGVLGTEWLSIARALVGLLNGEHGRLDAGTVDAWVRALAREHGFEEEV